MLKRLIYAGFVLLIVLSMALTSHGTEPKLSQASAFRSSELVASSPAEAQPMNPSTVRSLIEQTRQAWLTGDAAAFANLFAPEGEFIVPGNRWIGPEAVRQVAADYAAGYSLVEIEIRRILVEDNQALVEWYWHDRDKATGTESRADDAIVVDFDSGQISRWREYIDTQTPSAQPQAEST